MKHRVLATLILLLSAVIAKAQLELPPYPRLSLSHLYQDSALRESPQANERENFHSIGILKEITDTKRTDDYWLIESSSACCIFFEVAIRVIGLSEETIPQEPRVALFGSFETIDPSQSKPASPPDRSLIIDDRRIVVERIVPAEQLIERDNIVALMDSDSLKYYSRAIKEAGLYEMLSEQNNLTFFPPIDQAFEALGQDELDSLFSIDNREALRSLVLRHAVAKRFSSEDLYSEDSITNLNQESFAVTAINGRLRIAESRTLWEDIRGSNGSAHIINQILRPQHSLEAPPKMLHFPRRTPDAQTK